ncbi:hypothetical protein ACWGCW_35690 [Streptomyces sp. NPDC054933]
MAAAGLLTAHLAVPANAAPARGMSLGTLDYIRVDSGASASLPNPPNDQCIDLDGQARSVDNYTDQHVTLYAGAGCTDDHELQVLAPGQHWDWRDTAITVVEVQFG